FRLSESRNQNSVICLMPLFTYHRIRIIQRRNAHICIEELLNHRGTILHEHRSPKRFVKRLIVLDTTREQFEGHKLCLLSVSMRSPHHLLPPPTTRRWMGDEILVPRLEILALLVCRDRGNKRLPCRVLFDELTIC